MIPKKSIATIIKRFLKRLNNKIPLEVNLNKIIEISKYVILRTSSKKIKKTSFKHPLCRNNELYNDLKDE